MARDTHKRRMDPELASEAYDTQPRSQQMQFRARSRGGNVMMLKPASTADPSAEAHRSRDGVLRKELQRIFSQHGSSFPKQSTKAGTSSMREIKPWLTTGPPEDSSSIAIR